MLPYRLAKPLLALATILTFMLPITFPLQARTQPYTPEELSTIEEAGTYPVKVQYNDQQTGKTVSQIIYVTVHHKRTIENQQHQEAIDAHDITIPQDYFAKLTDEDLRQLAHAHAWNTQNGDPIPITTITRATVDKQIGHYTVTFATANQTTTTINVLETSSQVQNAQLYYNTITFPNIMYYLLLLAAIILLPAIFMFFTYRFLNKEVEKTDILLHKNKHKIPWN